MNGFSEIELIWLNECIEKIKTYRMALNPIDLLRKELISFESALKHSCESYHKGEIDAETHLIHKENLTKLIHQYKQAILILES
jgi:hypothetical protein